MLADQRQKDIGVAPDGGARPDLLRQRRINLLSLFKQHVFQLTKPKKIRRTSWPHLNQIRRQSAGARLRSPLIGADVDIASSVKKCPDRWISDFDGHRQALLLAPA